MTSDDPTRVRRRVPEIGSNSFITWQVLLALAVVVVTIAVAVVLGVVKRAHPVVAGGPLPVATVGQPGADSAACNRLMPALPGDLDVAHRRTLQGGGSGVAGWGDPPTILRCGMETPQELTCSSPLTVINGVSWLQLPTEVGLDETTYLAADRSVRIAVTVPRSATTAPITLLSSVIATALPAREPCRAGVLLPTDIK